MVEVRHFVNFYYNLMKKVKKYLSEVGFEPTPTEVDCDLKKHLAERSFDLRTSGLWAQHASTAPLCSLMVYSEIVSHKMDLISVWLMQYDKI